MDNKFIQQYGDEILCYRIRTARQKNRIKRTDFEKQLIGLHKEEKKLLEKRRSLGWEPLNPPVQRGFKRVFVLREDVARSKQADFYARILGKINTTDWSHRKDFLIKKRKAGRKIHVVKDQQLLRPDIYHFAKLDFTEKEKQQFHQVFYYERWAKRPSIRYVFNEPWRFVLRVIPNMIHKVPIKDWELESRLSEIESYLKRNDYEKMQEKLLRGYYKWGNWFKGNKYDESNPFKDQPLNAILDGIKGEFDREV